MADQKITALTSLAQADIVSGTDVLPIVDVGAPSVTKKATPKDVVGASVNDLVQTWNAGGTTFTAVKMNVTDTASAAASLLLDLQVGGTSQFRVTKAGRFVSLGRATIDTLTVGRGGGSTSGTTDTVVGSGAVANDSGGDLTAIGYRTLGKATNGAARCTAVGTDALRENLGASNNTAVGAYALVFTTTGTNNSALGNSALQSNTTGADSSGFGWQALFSNTTGSGNVGVGYQAGDVITTGARNTIVGKGSDPSALDGNDQTVVGEGLTGKGDDTAFIGGTNGAYNEKNVTTWETTSDARIKKDIADFAGGLDVLEQVRVRTFQYRTPDEITELPASAAINQPGVQLGVIAQELATVLPACVTENSTGVLSVNTDPLVWYLISAVKQLSAEVKALKGS